MAFACGLQAAAAAAGGGGGGSGGVLDAAARSLFVQAAKVITANAASVGDTLLGVPLLCSTGQHTDAVTLLQDGGLWYYAAALTSHSLGGPERTAALERWASHMAWTEGRPWAAVGLLVAAGALRSALQLLRQGGWPDAAQALVAACAEARVPMEQQALEGGELQNFFPGTQPVRRYNAVGGRVGEGQEADLAQQELLAQQGASAAAAAGVGAAGSEGASSGGQAGQQQVPEAHFTDAEAHETAKELQLYVCEVLCQL